MKSEAVTGQTSTEQILEDPAQDMHILDFLIVLSRRRKFILGFTIAAAVLSAIVVLLLPSEYTATTMVLPPGQSSSSSSALLGQLGGSGALASVAGASLGIKSPGEMYVSLFRSQTVENAVIQRFGLMSRYHAKKPSEAQKAFEHNSTVLLGAKDGLIRITVTDRDAKLSSDIANGYVDEFRKLSANLAVTEASQRRIFFQQQLLEAKENLTAAEEEMKKTQQSTGVMQIDSQSRSLIESAAQLRAQVVAKEVQLQAMRSYATDQNPDAIIAGQQLAALKAQLAKLAGTSQDSGSDMLVPKGKVPEAGMEYIRKLRDVRYYETISELIAKQFEIAKLDEARQGAIVQVVDPAMIPDTRSFPKRTITVTLVAVFALFVACVWVILASSLRQIKNDPSERERIAALRETFR